MGECYGVCTLSVLPGDGCHSLTPSWYALLLYYTYLEFARYADILK